MKTSLKRRLMDVYDDSGIALVTALLAMMVMASLATAAFSMSTHSLNSSANDRRRTQAVHAAEAGVDSFLLYLANSAQTSATQCPGGAGAPAATQTLTTTPASTFTVTTTYFTSLHSGTVLPCPAANPGAALIHSVGTSGGVSRTIEALYSLNGIQGGYPLFSGAVYTNGNATFNAQATMLPPAGNAYGGNLYANGNISMNAGGTIYGSVYSQGTLAIGGGAVIKQDAMSKLQLTTSGGPTVYGDARSATQGITTSNNTVVYGNANYCTGSAPTGIHGSTTGGDCNSGLPPVQPWAGNASYSAKQFTYTPTDWSSKGYGIQTFSDLPGNTACAQAQTFLAAIVSGDWVVRINSTCTLAYGGQSTINVKGNLALVSDGSLTMDSHATFTSSSAHNLYLMFNISTAVPCASTGISFNSQASIATTLSALLYTPCQVTFGAQSATLDGQIVAGGVSFGAGANITTVPMLIPGNNPNGYGEAMSYRREVTG
jgi:Tfp pilus assembly protein PilV